MTGRPFRIHSVRSARRFGGHACLCQTGALNADHGWALPKSCVALARAPPGLRGMITRALLLLVLANTVGCRCADKVQSVGPAVLVAEPAAVRFEETFVGAVRRSELTISNRGDSPGSVTFAPTPPFTLTPLQVVVTKGESVTVAVEFAPEAAGSFSVELVVGDQLVRLEGLAVAPPQCADPGVCRAATFDLTNGQCVTQLIPAGTPCETRCTRGTCSGAACVGVDRDCDDRDACTVDACAEAEGCVHAPRTCAAPDNPCLVARCDSLEGCVAEPVQDGTLCGPDRCALPEVSVCLAGACVTRVRPATGRCANRWVPLTLPRIWRVGMAFDEARGRTVLLSDTGNTWEWDGSVWTQRFPANAPPASRDVHLAFDPVRRRVLAVGRMGQGIGLETWAFDGVTWLRELPAVSPPLRTEFVLATDPMRRRVVLHAGAPVSTTPSPALRDTWEWDGFTWREMTPAGPPPDGRVYASMAFDRIDRELVLFGGMTGSGHAAETWLWNGLSWRRAAGGGPPGRNLGAMVDGPSGRPQLVGGFNGSLLDDFWEWRGTQWVQLDAGPSRPSARSQHGIAFDSVRRVLVTAGGAASAPNPSTWEWDGTTWRDRGPNQPSVSAGAMAYDTQRSRVVHYGGNASSRVSDETWEWDGRAWALVPVSNRPPPIIRSAMAYDEARRRIVLLGNTDDVYEYDGATDRKSTRLNSSHVVTSRMPSSA